MSDSNIWQSDGTNSSRLVDIGHGSEIGSLRLIGTRLFFAAEVSGAEQGREAYTIDLNAANANPVIIDVNPGDTSSNPLQFSGVGDSVFFSAATGQNPIRKLFRYNSQTAQLIGEVQNGGDNVGPLTVVNGVYLFYAADDAAFGRELHRVGDVGQVFLYDLAPAAASSTPVQLFAAGDRLYFTARGVLQGQSGFEIWRVDSNNPNASAILVRDIVPGDVGSTPQSYSYRSSDNTVFFLANSAANQENAGPIIVWRTQGTSESTSILETDLGSAYVDPLLGSLAVAGDKLYFVASGTKNNMPIGTELWVFSNPTPLANAGRIGQLAWLDQNRDGLYDPSEPPAVGIVVNLLDVNGTVVATATTDFLGVYEFYNVTPGTYRLQFVLPENFSFATPNVGNDEYHDSDVTLTEEGLTDAFTVSPNQEINWLTAGLWPDSDEEPPAN